MVRVTKGSTIKLMINRDTLIKFLSSKINIIILILIGYVLIGYAWSTYNIPLTHQLLMYMILGIINLLIHIMGVSRGMYLSAIHKNEIDNFLKILTKNNDKSKKNKK